MVSALLALTLGVQSRGGPQGVFLTDFPQTALNVIAGAPTKSSVNLSMLAAADTDFNLTVRKGPSASGRLKAGEPKSVTLTGLAAGATYEYDVTTSDSHFSGRFTTARPPGASFVFDVQADSHLDGNSSLAVYENTLGNERADKPDFLVDLGDTFMVDKYKDFKASLPQYQAQRHWFSLIGSQASVFLCLGNHDGETGWVMGGKTGVTPWAREQRRRYFPYVERDGFYSGAPDQGLYYAWTWGDALFVVLDPFLATTRKPRDDSEGWNWTLGQTQYTWLRSTLQSSTSKYKFVFIHHLVGGSGKEARGGTEFADKLEWGDASAYPEKRADWAETIHRLMAKHHVTAVFHGHDHLYVHQERDGVTYLEVPQPSEARGGNTSSAAEYGYRTGTLLGGSGHIRVSVTPESARFDYVKSRPGSARNAEVADTFTARPIQN